MDCDPEPTDMNIAYGDFLTGGNCAVGSGGDVDLFRFNGTVGDYVVLSLGDGGSSSLTQPCFEVRDPVNQIVIPNTCAPNSSKRVKELLLPSSGSYLILVREDSNDAVPFGLNLDRLVPPTASSDTFPCYGCVINSSIVSKGDMDPYLFSASAGDQVLITLGDGGSSSLTQPCMSLRNLAGTPTSEGARKCAPNNNVTTIEQTISETGVYTVLVSEDSNDGIDFGLDVQCLVGPCNGTIPPPPPTSPLGPEYFGSVKADFNWLTFDLREAPLNPVVILGPPTFKGSDPGVARLRNVNQDDFEVRFQEWNYLERDLGDTQHVFESMSFLALSEGRQTMPDGSIWEVGTFSLNGTTGTKTWKTISFSQSFSNDQPYLFLTIQTTNDNEAVTVRARNVTKFGFEAALVEEEFLNSAGHGNETVGYLAISNPTQEDLVGLETLSGRVELEGRDVPYNLHRIEAGWEVLRDGDGKPISQTAEDRFVDAVGADILMHEERSLDSELTHLKETIDVLAIGSQIFAQDVSTRGVDPASLRKRLGESK